MFAVRSSPCPAPDLQSSPCTLGAVAPVCRPAPCPPFGSRQRASAFNQPLSLDTSSVTTMSRTFCVRSAPCPAPNLHRAHPGRPPPSRPPPYPPPDPQGLAPHHMPSPSVSRQEALAFNQLLSFDTSSVTTMYWMFQVRSSRVPCPQSPVGPSPARCLRTPVARRLTPPDPHYAPHRIYALLLTHGRARRRSTSR